MLSSGEHAHPQTRDWTPGKATSYRSPKEGSRGFGNNLKTKIRSWFRPSPGPRTLFPAPGVHPKWQELQGRRRKQTSPGRGRQAVPGGPLRAWAGVGPRHRVRVVHAHLGAGMRLGAASEGDLVGEAGGGGLRFCHGLATGSRRRSPGKPQSPRLQVQARSSPTARPRGHRGAVGSDLQPIVARRTSWVSAYWVPGSQSTPGHRFVRCPKTTTPKVPGPRAEARPIWGGRRETNS